MRKKIIAILIVTIVLVIVGTIYFAGVFRPKGAGLLINTTPTSAVFVNGVQSGTTPYEEIHDAGEIYIKLVPESFEMPLAPYETKIVLESGIQTIIQRSFSDTENKSSGETVSFEKGPREESSIVVISDPEGTQVEIDDIIKGFTPYKSVDISEGKHAIKITANGFSEYKTEIKTAKGYKLTLFVKLAQTQEPVVEDVVEPLEEEIPVKVEIVDTPTGFLRVRQDASSTGSEVARVEPGDIFEVSSESEDGEWLQIEYESDKLGWVSKQYTTAVTEETEDEENIEDQN